jgi:hypothetical protein
MENYQRRNGCDFCTIAGIQSKNEEIPPVGTNDRNECMRFIASLPMAVMMNV